METYLLGNRILLCGSGAPKWYLARDSDYETGAQGEQGENETSEEKRRARQALGTTIPSVWA